MGYGLRKEGERNDQGTDRLLLVFLGGEEEAVERNQSHTHTHTGAPRAS
jgi:hypothetical protein